MKPMPQVIVALVVIHELDLLVLNSSTAISHQNSNNVDRQLEGVANALEVVTLQALQFKNNLRYGCDRFCRQMCPFVI